MIKSFKCKETQKLFKREMSRKVVSQVVEQARRKLLILNAATEIQTLRVPPSNRLEKRKGRRAGQHSIRINDQWRICFVWKGSDAYDVEIVDSH